MSLNINTLKEAIQGDFWKELTARVEGWEKDLRDIQDTTDSQIEMFRCQGRIEAVKYFLMEPHVMLEELLEEKENKDDETGAER